MGKKIIILNGSPRKNGNTATLCDEFTKGAESAGHAVIRFNLQSMDIHACLGCMKGGKDATSPCVQKDDMDKIYPAYQAADIVVLASPMYYWSFSAQLKTAFDRLFAVMEARNNSISRKKCILLMAAGDDSAGNWQPVCDYYKALLERMAWEDGGMVLAGGVLNIGDIQGNPCLEEARKLGAALL